MSDKDTRLEPAPPLPKAAPYPKELSPEYHKAHKQLMLWAAILFVWEFVGIDLDKAKDAAGYAGALVKSIKSPQAVPWVLLALVLYFLFKCSTEWAQCHADRRHVRFAKIDFFSAWIVSLAAITLYIVQTISRVQLADKLKTTQSIPLALGMVLGITGMYGISKLVGFFIVRIDTSGKNRGWLVELSGDWKIAVAQISFAVVTTVTILSLEKMGIKVLTDHAIIPLTLIVIGVGLWMAGPIAAKPEVWMARLRRLREIIRKV